LREREGEMARKTGKKGSAIILLVVVAILAAGPPAVLVKAFGGNVPSTEASWAE
jgi:flagellar basal body-associated protein FliL